MIFSSFSFEGVGFLLTTGPWFWPLLFKFVLFWLLSEISSVLPNATGWSCVTCSVLTVSASDAVRRVYFGVLSSHSSFWLLVHGGKFLRGLTSPAQVWLGSYSKGDLPPCCRVTWLQVLWDGPLFPSSGVFHPSSSDAFRHSSILLSYVLLDPVFASFALVKAVPVTLCSLLLFAICDYLVITGGLDFPMLGLDFYSFVTLLLRLDVLRLPHFRHYSLLLPVGESTVLQRLPFDDWHFTYVSELLDNDFCHRWPYYCSVIGLGVILLGLFFMMMTSLVWLLCGRNFRFLSWLVSVLVLHRSTVSFPCNLGLYFLLSPASFLRFERLACSPFPFWDLWWGFLSLLGGEGVPSSFGFSWSPYGHVAFSLLALSIFCRWRI